MNHVIEQVVIKTIEHLVELNTEIKILENEHAQKLKSLKENRELIIQKLSAIATIEKGE